MFFVLSKTLQYLFFPFTWLFLVLVGTLIWYHRKRTRAVLLFSIVCLYVLSLPITSNSLERWIEVPRASLETLAPSYDVAIVLAGMGDLRLSSEDRIEFGRAVDRVLTGISFLKHGRVNRLLIAGGSGHLFNQGLSEAVLLRKFAVEFGVPEDRIVIDEQSRNTYENAVNAAALLTTHNYERAVLITSAAHMRRAEAAFHSQGVFPDTYPVDFNAVIEFTPFSLVPTVDSLAQVTAVMHEVVGFVMYRFVGYI